MTYTQEDLELVEKHVAQAERNVLQQRAIIAELTARGYPTGVALDMLASLEVTLGGLRLRLGRVRAKVFDSSARRFIDHAQRCIDGST